jgi:zinc finger FYVE domain-containing protein 26
MMQILMVNVIISLLHMDDLSLNLTHCVSPERYSELGNGYAWENNDLTPSDEGNKVVISFTEILLDILHRSLSSAVIELEQASSEGVTVGGKHALEWRVSIAKHFIEEWEWRLSILQRLLPLSERQWRWKEALTVLRAAPSKLLNL